MNTISAPTETNTRRRELHHVDTQATPDDSASAALSGAGQTFETSIAEKKLQSQAQQLERVRPHVNAPADVILGINERLPSDPILCSLATSRCCGRCMQYNQEFSHLQLNTTLKAKVDMLRSNLAEVRDDAERASVFEKQVEVLKEQLQEATASAVQPPSAPDDLLTGDGSPSRVQLPSRIPLF